MYVCMYVLFRHTHAYWQRKQWPVVNLKARGSVNLEGDLFSFVQLFRLGGSGFLLSKASSFYLCKNYYLPRSL